MGGKLGGQKGGTGGNITIMEAGSMDGSSAELLLHELGHNLDLDFGGIDPGHTSDEMKLQNAVEFLGKKSTIKSEYDGTTLGLKSPSRDTFEKWKNWMKIKGIKCP